MTQINTAPPRGCCAGDSRWALHWRMERNLDPNAALGGWSEEEMLQLLSPTKETSSSSVFQEAGWSPDALLQALSPSPQVGTKRQTAWKSPNTPYSSPLNYKKMVDLKETPPCRISKTSIIDISDESELDVLSQSLAMHSLSHNSPKASFRSAKLCFDEARLRSEYVNSFNLDEPLVNGWKLYDFQKQTIRHCLGQDRTILALDMGLGKTVISLMWAKLTWEARNRSDAPIVIVVVSPCTLMNNWEREATALGFRCGRMNDKVTSFSASDSSPYLLLTSWTQVPVPEAFLSRLSAQVSCNLQNVHQREHCKHSFPVKYLVIADEAHAMQTLTSQRTQAAIRLCLHPSCAGVVLATGTPMKNGRPANILPLLIALRHPLGRNRTHFEKRYCAAKKTRFCPWDTSGASNLEELRTKIGHSLIRKTKEECLPELPRMNRVRIKATLSPSVQRGYQDILNKYKSQKQRNKMGSASGLEMMTQLRQYTSAAKVPFTVSLVLQLLKEKPESPIVIFVWFRETALSLITQLRDENATGLHLRSAYITGDIVKQQERQEVVDLFQSGQLDILICSFGVGSTGLTLTRSSRLLLLDRPWTPGDARQAEDRIRRIGQRATEVQSLWIAGFSFDDSLDKLLQKKDRNSLKVMEVTDGENILKGSRTPSSWFTSSQVSEESSKSSDIRAYFTGTGQHLSSGGGVRPEALERQWWEGDEEGAEEEGQERENTDPEASESKIMMTVLREILL